MLKSLGHGQKTEFSAGGTVAGVAAAAITTATSETAPASAVWALPKASLALMLDDATPDRFGYMFDGDGLPETTGAFDNLGAVGAAMTTGGLPGPSGLAAVLTYFGQFVDHDITANTDRDPAALPKFAIAKPQLTRNSRDAVRAQLGNLRRGTLRLDSVYGDDMPIDAKLRIGAKMRVGRTGGAESESDLPRYGPLIGAGVLTPADLPSIADMNSDFRPVVAERLAFIADSRNDENLIVAQLHLAFLKFHNAVADTVAGSDDARFEGARQLTRWHYQWLIVERYLAAICDPAMLADVIARAASRYVAFADRTGGAAGDSAPLPLEFSVAAFRFGHSMIRPGYAFNATFPRASMRQLFEFTGRGGLAGADVLPDTWIIDWRNFTATAPANLQALPIDAALAAPLADLPNEDGPHLRSLAQRNLRRSYVLNLPTAQAIIMQLATEGVDVDPLDPAELTASPGGQALQAAGLEAHCPLWLYVLAEAGARGGGKRLGKLGSLIVAETLVGLLVVDPESYWHAGAGGGRWTPSDAGLPGQPIDSFDSFFSFAGVL